MTTCFVTVSHQCPQIYHIMSLLISLPLCQLLIYPITQMISLAINPIPLRSLDPLLFFRPCPLLLPPCKNLPPPSLIIASSEPILHQKLIFLCLSSPFLLALLFSRSYLLTYTLSSLLLFGLSLCMRYIPRAAGAGTHS
ncbi:hypothetical protein B0O99DRAFT_136001 [Bisporella sp. PMI_857]|nr:hypothetical protein B0O99DRAFT_136001 [Bisporella sp. PMI_857]